MVDSVVRDDLVVADVADVSDAETISSENWNGTF
jgi:hypothetical protein